VSNTLGVPALNADDIKGLVRRASGRGHTGSRNRALVSAFVGAGLGVSEALSVTVADLDEPGARVRVGGGRGRSVAVDPSVMVALMTWVEARRGLGLADDTGPLFCTRDGLPLEASYVRRLIARLGREAGVEGVVNARTLRESYAAARLADGATVEDLREELGHASIASTQRFVRQLGGVPAPRTVMGSDLASALFGVAHAGLAVLRAERGADGAIADFVMEYVNPAAAGILGRAPEDLPGASVRDVFPNSPTDGTYARWIELIETQGELGTPRLYESEGRTRLFRVRRLAHGDRILMSFEDQGAARAAERAAGQLQARQTAFLECSQGGVFIMEPNGTIAVANAAAHRILGVASGRLVGLSPLDPRWRPTMPDGSQIDPAELPSALTRATGQPIRDREMAFTRSDGRMNWISVSTEPVETGGGAPFGVAVTFTDLGTLRRIGARARACEEAGRLMQAVSGTILLRCRPDLTIMHASGPVAEFLGRTADELIGTRCTDWVDEEDRQAVRDVHLHALESRDSVGIDHGIRDGSGTLVSVSRVVRAVRDPSTGEVEELQSVIQQRD
jgi:PAS domain S-box-containing protein